MSNIEKIIRQAVSTFSKPQTRIMFQENLNSLIQNVSQITLSDLFLDKEFISSFDRSQDRYSNNNIIYISVFEDHNIIVSVFVLKSKSHIPLHDHPLMHGILKVISGSVQIQSYSLPEQKIKQRSHHEVNVPSEFFFLEDHRLYDSDNIRAIKNPPIVMNDQDDCAFLSPLQNNIHEVCSYHGPSAFLDILTPPYETHIEGYGSRNCTYFVDNGISNNETMLSKLWRHPDYWTKEVPYKGPRIRMKY